MNIKNLISDLRYLGEVSGKRQTYYIFEGNRFYVLLSFSRGKSNAGNFTYVEKGAVRYIYQLVTGDNRITANKIVEKSKKPQFIKTSLDALNVLYILVVLRKAIIDKRYKIKQLIFNIK